MVNVPVLFGNSGGSKSLHGSNRIIGGRDWAARIPDQAAAINSSGAWIYGGQEIHAKDDGWSDSSYPAGGHQYLLAALKALAAEWEIAGGKYGNWTYYRSSHLSVVAVVNHHFSGKFNNRGVTDVLFQDLVTGFQFHHGNTHYTPHKDPGRPAARKLQARETAAYFKDKGRAVVGGDINASSYKSGDPRDIMTKAGWKGLRERGITVTNGGLSTFSKSSKQSYWLDDIFTRTSEVVSGATLMKTNGVSSSTIITDHNWLLATVGFDTGITPPLPTPSTRPTTELPPPTDNPWVASVRLPDYKLAGPTGYTSLTLVENYNAPDMLTMTARTEDLGETFEPGAGIVLMDDYGHQRFSGPVTSIEQTGEGITNLVFTGDLVWTSWRACYPVPAADWTTAGQTVTSYATSGSAESRLLDLINKNLGPGAIADTSGNEPRRHPLLRLPASVNRGPSAKTTAVPTDTVLSLAAVLAEAAELRLRIVQTYDADGTPHLDVKLDNAPDYSDWVQFGSAEGGAEYVLGAGWRYKIDVPTTTTVLSIGSIALPENAAEGAVEPPTYGTKTDADAENFWWARIEAILDQTGTTDATEIAAAIDTALSAGSGPTEISLPPVSAPGLGTLIPPGTQVTAMLGDVPIVDRIRQITTVISDADGQATVTTTGIIGDPNASAKTPTQRKLAALLRRVQNLERMKP